MIVEPTDPKSRTRERKITGGNRRATPFNRISYYCFSYEAGRRRLTLTVQAGLD